MTKRLYFFVSDAGHSGLVAAGDRDEARELVEDKGLTVAEVRVATDADVKWVWERGGWVPRVERPAVDR